MFERLLQVHGAEGVWTRSDAFERRSFTIGTDWNGATVQSYMNERRSGRSNAKMPFERSERR